MIVDDIARELDTAGVGVYSPGAPLAAGVTPVAVGVAPSGFDRCVTVTTYSGGPPPDARNGWEYPRLQVRVRSLDPLDALQLDRAVHDALQLRVGGPAPRQLASGWWLQDCYALQSAAQPLGVDNNGRHEYVRNYQLDCSPS